MDEFVLDDDDDEPFDILMRVSSSGDYLPEVEVEPGPTWTKKNQHVAGKKNKKNSFVIKR